MGAFEAYPRISPFLWYNGNAAEAADFYVGIFRNARKIEEVRIPSPDGPPEGRVLTVAFELDGQKFTAINGGPMYAFTEAVSFVIRCETQDEIDHYWSSLTGGGAEGRCGWLKDKFGLSWQVIPSRLPQLIRHPRAMQAMLGMKKLDIAALEAAAQS